METLLNFTNLQLITIGLLFAWTGFVRSGLGFGGAALGLPLLLFVDDNVLFWLPLIGLHLLFFSGLTLRTRIHHIDKAYLKKALVIILPFTLIGVFGLITLPTQWLLTFVYGVALLYSLMWVLGIDVKSNNNGFDYFLLAVGGYVSGTSLTGAPLIAAVFMRHVAAEYLRNTLFVLWFLIVSIKLCVFVALGINLNVVAALCLIPIAAVGHIAGLKAHNFILQNNHRFKQITGLTLAIVSGLGLAKVWLSSF